jgi:imidazole glycerol phosphate synthase glutamine amidotransferase subunit
VNDVAVIATGTANLASVLAALRRADVDPVVTSDQAVVRQAKHVVLPGVGAFAAALERLRLHGLDEALLERMYAERPTLGICLGLQLFARGSEENPGTPGLALWDVEVRRFATDVRTPQLGWNRVRALPGAELLQDGWAYFANTYHLARVPEGWTAAMAEHGGSFVAALERGTALACQFHPELSGRWGHELLCRWLEQPC